MTLSEDNRKTLLVHLHKVLSETANLTANQINDGKTDELIDYPPNGGLTDEEKQSLKVLEKNRTLRDAIRKVLASNSAFLLFEVFNIIDGTSDPDPDIGPWNEIMLVDQPEDDEEHHEFLHDHFYETYWDWRNKGNLDFKLDLLDE